MRPGRRTLGVAAKLAANVTAEGVVIHATTLTGLVRPKRSDQFDNIGSVSDRDVDERVRAYLLAGDFGSRRRIPSERDLALELGISRPALREALKTLSDLGVLEVRRGDGAYLAFPDSSDLLHVRERLEPLAAKLAAANLTTEDITGLRGAIAQMETSLDHPSAFAAGDEQVHQILADASGNAVLQRTLEQLSDMARFSRQATVKDPRARAETLADVHELVAHVVAGQGDEAEAAMHRHLQHLAAANSGHDERESR
jgi:GntR family transcriptional regulator, transcriptional repressor for pyruvate dehydrogenase complex